MFAGKELLNYSRRAPKLGAPKTCYGQMIMRMHRYYRYIRFTIGAPSNPAHQLMMHSLRWAWKKDLAAAGGEGHFSSEKKRRAKWLIQKTVFSPPSLRSPSKFAIWISRVESLTTSNFLPFFPVFSRLLHSWIERLSDRKRRSKESFGDAAGAFWTAF